MKQILLVTAIVLAAATFALGQQKNPKLEAELIKMDKAWTAAELKGDTKAAGMYVADDFLWTNTDGTMNDKTQYLASLKASTDTDVADDFNVRFFGDTAIMTHRGTVKGERDYQYRSTHIWMKRGGHWQIVAHHSNEFVAAKP
jgi:ketosteroid isomerase-like protein